MFSLECLSGLGKECGGGGCTNKHIPEGLICQSFVKQTKTNWLEIDASSKNRKRFRDSRNENRDFIVKVHPPTGKLFGKKRNVDTGKPLIKFKIK